MSKSLGNFYTLRDLMGMGYAPEAIRYLLASVPYRKKLNFTFEGLKAAGKSIERLREFEARLASAKLPAGRNEVIAERSREAIRQFQEALDDDLNTAQALAAVFEYVREMNTALDENQFCEGNRWEDAARVLEVFDRIFDVLKPSALAKPTLSDTEIEERIAERMRAKQARDFARADAIRAELLEQGVIIEDTKDGVRWRRK